MLERNFSNKHVSVCDDRLILKFCQSCLVNQFSWSLAITFYHLFFLAEVVVQMWSTKILWSALTVPSTSNLSQMPDFTSRLG